MMSEEQLTGVLKNWSGEIISFQTSSGRIISYRKAMMEVEAGKITGVTINGTAEANEVNDYSLSNLEDLPEIN